MPDEMVEKVARAIYEARGAHELLRAWWKWEDIGDEARAVWCQCATAALAAMGEREAVAADGMPATIWAGSCSALGAPDTGYWYPVRTPSTPTEYVRASPRPEAVEEAVKAGDWRAVDDAIWFFLGHENHKPEEAARLRRMSGVVLGLATEGSKG